MSQTQSKPLVRAPRPGEPAAEATPRETGSDSLAFSEVDGRLPDLLAALRDHLNGVSGLHTGPGDRPARVTEQDLATLQRAAEFLEQFAHEPRLDPEALSSRTARMRRVIDERRFSIVLQPIYRTADRTLRGFEALSRFPDTPACSPEWWFAEAGALGLGAELEFATLDAALAELPALPAPLSLALNLSPPFTLLPRFAASFGAGQLDRVVLELTEHAAIEDAGVVRAALAPLRARGLRVAIDDVGAGHANFKHVLDLKPDIIKLDTSLIRDIDRDQARRALAEALTRFGRAIGSVIVAEGVETPAEFDTLRAIGVTKVQGYLVGRPLPLPEALRLPRELAPG